MEREQLEECLRLAGVLPTLHIRCAPRPRLCPRHCCLPRLPAAWLALSRACGCYHTSYSDGHLPPG